MVAPFVNVVIGLGRTQSALSLLLVQYGNALEQRAPIVVSGRSGVRVTPRNAVCIGHPMPTRRSSFAHSPSGNPAFELLPADKRCLGTACGGR